jgi:hypothetical protein
MTKLHNSHIIRVLAKPFAACSIFTSRFLATICNNVDSLILRLRFSHRILSYRTLLNWLFNRSPRCLHDSSSARTTQKHPVSNNNSIFECVFVAAGTCWPSRCLQSHRLHAAKCSVSPYQRHHQYFDHRIDVLACSGQLQLFYPRRYNKLAKASVATTGNLFRVSRHL